MCKYTKYKIIQNNYDSDSHFKYCENLMIPFITVKIKTKKYSYVEVDMIAISQAYPNIMDFIEKYLNDNGFVLMILEDLKIIKHSSQYYSHLGSLCYSVEILTKYAEKFAISLFDFYYAAIKKAIKMQKGVNKK
ncbi:hypothetical protein FDB52_05035 [Clostridium botulinum]|nr:hypothetical protein [Clostridium botulinum]NFN47918.1 hypothetical protein [Clostridium botulinum]